MRQVVPTFVEDGPRYHDIAKIKDYLLTQKAQLPLL
jgi:hypothetical protein